MAGRPVGTTRAAGYTVSGGRQPGRHYPKKLPTGNIPGCTRPGIEKFYEWGDPDMPELLCKPHASEADANNGHVAGGCECGSC